jgi:hypothetical protein
MRYGHKMIFFISTLALFIAGILLVSGNTGSANRPTASPQRVALFANAGTFIYYTTDGSNPTKAGHRYTKPFWISRTTRLKTRAFSKDGGPPSDLLQGTYTIGVQ